MLDRGGVGRLPSACGRSLVCHATQTCCDLNLVRELFSGSITIMHSSKTVDQRLAEMAGVQHGLVTRPQLLLSGISDGAIERRNRRGSLHRIARGVYAVGHTAVPLEARWMAAVLACGEGAVLSHMSAVKLWGIDRSTRMPQGVVEVSTSRKLQSPSWIRIHRVRCIREDDVVVRNRIRVTTPERTVLDLAALLPAERIANLIHEAEFRGILCQIHLAETMKRGVGHRGLAALSAALELNALGSAGIRSGLEAKFMNLVRRAGVPAPLINTRVLFGVTEFELDFHWPSLRLCVEVDGEGHVRSRTQREDADRDAVLRAHGWRVERFDRDAIETQPGTVIETLRRNVGVGV